MKHLALSFILRSWLILAILATGSFLAAQQVTDSEKISELFGNIRQHAAAAEKDADLLESYTRSSVSWKSHADRITMMKEHVNDLIKDFNDAKDLRSEGSTWQQEAIDQIEPLLQGMAEHLTATIQHLNENQTQTGMPAWRDYVKANREYAFKNANLIRDVVEYGEAKSSAEALEKKLAIPTPPGQE